MHRLFSSSCYTNTNWVFQKRIDFSSLYTYVDVESAYNNVLTDQLVTMLDKINIGSRICKYLWSFLSNK